MSDVKDDTPPPDRIRAVEQIKRLLAVMMGAASVGCITNIVTCLRAAGDQVDRVALLLATAVVVFFSLIIPYYLSIERHLEKVYLDPSRRNPKWLTLVWDIVAMVLTAIWFVVLAQSFPVGHLPAGIEAPLAVDEIIKGSAGFVAALYLLLAGDTATLVVSLCIWVASRTAYDKAVTRVLTWIALNAITAWVTYVFASAVVAHSVRLEIACWSMIVVHVLRFLLDFFLHHSDFYFTKWPRPHEKTAI